MRRAPVCCVLPPVEVNLLAEHVLPLQLALPLLLPLLPLPLIGSIRHGARGALRLRLGLWPISGHLVMPLEFVDAHLILSSC